jgi:malate dehydrogenase (quinone)
MLDVLQKCFPEHMAEWTPQLKKMVPSFGKTLSDDPKLAERTLETTQKVLEIA